MKDASSTFCVFFSVSSITREVVTVATSATRMETSVTTGTAAATAATGTAWTRLRPSTRVGSKGSVFLHNTPDYRHTVDVKDNWFSLKPKFDQRHRTTQYFPHQSSVWCGTSSFPTLLLWVYFNFPKCKTCEWSTFITTPLFILTTSIQKSCDLYVISFVFTLLKFKKSVFSNI